MLARDVHKEKQIPMVGLEELVRHIISASYLGTGLYPRVTVFCGNPEERKWGEVG